MTVNWEVADNNQVALPCYDCYRYLVCFMGVGMMNTIHSIYVKTVVVVRWAEYF